MEPIIENNKKIHKRFSAQRDKKHKKWKVSGKSILDYCNSIPKYQCNGKRRLTLIYNHFEFKTSDHDGCKHSNRIGTQADVKRLTVLLKKLDYVVIVFDDLNKSELFESVYQVRYEYKDLLKECDSIMVIILTHGGKGNTLMAHDGHYDLFEFMEYFTPERFIELASKAKLFFVQACRGDKTETNFIIGDGDKSNGTSDLDGGQFCDNLNTHKKHSEFPMSADFFIGFSTHYGHVSYRNILFGSWYIQALCDIIEDMFRKQSLHIHDIYEIHIMLGLNQNQKHTKNKQISAHYSTLSKKFYFK